MILRSVDEPVERRSAVSILVKYEKTLSHDADESGRIQWRSASRARARADSLEDTSSVFQYL